MSSSNPEVGTQPLPVTMADQSIAKVIRKRREELGLTQAQLAKRLGVHKQTVVKYEAGAINIPSNRLLALAVALQFGFRLEGIEDPSAPGFSYAGRLVLTDRGGEALYVAESPEQYDEEPVTVTRDHKDRILPRKIPRHLRNLPLAVREYLAEFQLRLTRSGATEEEIDEALELMRSPELFTFYKGGMPSEYPEADVLRGMKAIGEGVVIPELRDRGRKIP